MNGIEGLYVFIPQGAFYLWCEVEQKLLDRLNLASVEDFSEFLTAQGIGNAPGDSFGVSCKNAIRFAFSCSTEMVTHGTDVLRKILL